MADPKSGDKVKITCKDTEYVGTIIPRPDILEKGITVLKLDNGYNVGIRDSEIKKTEVLESPKPKEKKAKEHKSNKKLPNIALLSIGGTIASRVDYATGGVVADYSGEDYVDMIPELKDIANIHPKKVSEIMSEDMAKEDWMKIAKETLKALKEFDGVVITQGTDTLHYTSAALSFLFSKLNKPIILTASQRSIDRGSSDAFLNLLCSVRAAVELKTPGVFVCMHSSSSDDYCNLINGTKVRKMHTSRRDAFRPINGQPFAKAFPDKIEMLDNEYSKDTEDPKIDGNFEDVGFVKAYPSMKHEIIDFFIKNGVKGIVIEATGLGNIPKGLAKAIEKVKVPVVITSQTIYGRVHPLVYSNLRELSIKLGCIFTEDMPPETAYVKLMWALSKENKKEDVKQLMLTNIAGEISERTGSYFLV